MSGGAILAIALVALVGWLMLRARRKMYDQLSLEFVQWLKQHRPQLAWVRENAKLMTLRHESGLELHLSRQRLYMAAARGRSLEARGAEYQLLADGLMESAQAQALSPADGARLRPILVRSEDVALIARRASPHRPVPGLPLEIMYVLDSENAMRFVFDENLPALGVSAAELHERAIANLAAVHAVDAAVRKTIDASAVSQIAIGDDYDATRLLLVPALLRDGEALVALLPELNWLALAPANAKVEELAAMARSVADAAHRPLLARPVRVTRAGFTLL